MSGRKLPEWNPRHAHPHLQIFFCFFRGQGRNENNVFPARQAKPDYGGHIEIGTALAGGASVPASRTIRLAIPIGQEHASRQPYVSS